MDGLEAGSRTRWGQSRSLRDSESMPCHRGAGLCRLIVGNDEAGIGIVVADLVDAASSLGTAGQAAYILRNA